MDTGQLNPPKHRKKTRKRSRGPHKNGGGHHRQSEQPTLPPRSPNRRQKQQIDNQKSHQKALALSQQLRQLSCQKRLKECIEIYHSPAHDGLRDAHHGSIMVDCCARCGDVEEAENIVNGMLHSQKSKKTGIESGPYFWEGHKQFSSKQVPIQAWTALLKGYVHVGKMAKADSLFHYLCTTRNTEGGNKSRKRKRSGVEIGPNVRTLNTLLRGCLWTATTINNDYITSMINKKGGSDTVLRNELVGGIMTAEKAWSLCEGNVSFDSSSYEYFISILSQSLQCKLAEDCLQKMISEFGIQVDNSDATDPTLVESVVVCLVVIAQGYSLLGKASDAMRCAEEALRYLDVSASAKNEFTSPSSNGGAVSTKNQTTGGKRSWKANASLKDGGNSNGRREESNKLFRNHRQSELRSEATSLRNLCSSHSSKQGKQANCITATSASRMAQFLLTRLLYFSGGGTTGKDATKAVTSSTKANIDQDIQQWTHSLWHSFGLKQTIQRMIGSKKENNNLKALKGIFTLAQSKTRPNMLSPEVCGRLRTHFLGERNPASRDGHINFKELFSSLDDVTLAPPNGNGKPLHIELGAGSGDWAALQATLNPIENYVTVELRADRVAQTFRKCFLRQVAVENGGSGPLTNLCCVGSECGSFLRDRVSPGSVNTIFVNHPEPPTQTYNADNTIASGAGAEEPAHMLNSQILLSAARCLQPNGEGRLVIVTDNFIYAQLICRILIHVLEEGAKLVGLSPGDVRDLRRVKSFGNSSIHLFEGKPSVSIGHYTPRKFEGTSYFDRLWRTGAGKHADARKRFIIALRTSGGNVQNVNKGSKKFHEATRVGGNKQSPNHRGEGRKPNKKRSAEKQRRRNERRLLKKEQLTEREKELK